MFHNQYPQGPEDSESAAVNPQVLNLPLDLPVSHTAHYPYPANTAQQSGYERMTYASTDETTPASQNAREVLQFQYATPDTAPMDTPRYWGGFPTNDMVLRPQGLFDSNNNQLPAELSNIPQGSLGLPTNGFIRQAPLSRGSAALALPPSSEGNSLRPGHTKPTDKPSSSDFPLSRNTPGVHQPRGSRIEKTRRPARQSKKRVALSSLESSKASRTAPPPVLGQQNPDPLTISTFYIWMVKNPGFMPSEHDILSFSLVYHYSVETVRNWFLRNVATHQNNDDTGYQTMTNSSIDVASACHRRRSHCNRKADKLRDEDTGSTLIERDETRPFACTSRCGKKFGKKDGWKRHEEMNHPPKVWRCRFMGCQNERKCVYFRRDKFRRHLRKAHPTLNVTKTVIDSCCVPIKSNFSKYCLFHYCDEQFNNWKERIDHIGKHLKDDPWDVSQWRQADDEIEESDDAGGSDSEESSDSDSTSDNDDSDDSDADTGHGHKNGGREAGSGPHARGFKSSRGQRDQGSQRRFNGGATNDLSGYKCSLSHDSPDLITSGSVPTYCNHPVLPISNTESSSSGKLSASYARITIIDDKCTGPRSLVEAVLGPLGCGSKASVHEVKIQGYNGTVARKVIRHTSLRKKWGIDREVRIMARFNHPHITRLIEGYEDANSTTLLMLPVADCNLLQYLSGCSLGLSMGGDIEGWFNCLSSGLHHIHEQGVRHRDIKPSNILVKNNGLLYSDFGSSNLVADEESIGSESADFTEQYAAPEVYRGERGRAADVWSLGCIFLEIVTCLLRQPVEDMKAKKRQRLNPRACSARDSRSWQWAREWNQTLRLEAARSSASPHISVVLDSCEAMMRLQPKQRLTAAEILGKFAPCRCWRNQPRTGSENDQQLESIPESHEANTDRDEDLTPHIVLALVKSSEASILSDISSSDTISPKDNNIPNFLRDPWLGHIKSAISIAPADTYIMLLDPKASCESMIQHYLLEDGPFEKFLVSGESRYVPRSDNENQDMGKAVAVGHYDHGHIDHGTVTDTLNSGASKLFIHGSPGASKAHQLPVFRDHQRHPPVLECPFNFLHCTKQYTMEDLNDWFDHSLFHFTKEGGGLPRLTIPPTSSECCFCGFKIENIDGLSCWVERMRHVAWHHYSGQSLSHALPDFKLFRYLCEKGIIGTVEYRELGNLRQQHPHSPQKIPTPPSLPLNAIPELQEWHKGTCIGYTIERTKSCTKSILHTPPANRTHTLKTASRDYARTREVLAGMPHLDNEKEQQDCMNSLRLGAANARMSLIGDGEKNTGEWILTDSLYRGWRNEPSPTRFWLHGTSGAGKSTLAKQMIANMLRMAGADPNPPNGLLCNIWDSDELDNLVKNSERCIDLTGRLPSLLTEAALQFIDLGQTSNAEDMYRRALEGRERVLGLEHPETLISVGNLACMLREQGKYAAAEEMYRRALEGRERILGPEHPDTSSSTYNLASLFNIQKRYNDASPLYLRALKGFSNVLGPNHPTTQECFQHYSSMMHEMES